MGYPAGIQTLIKRPSEVRFYSYNFASFPEIQTGGDSLNHVVSVVCTAVVGTDPNYQVGATTDLTIGTPSIPSGALTTVQAKISGGLDRNQYEVQFTVTTAAGATLVGTGYLAVQDN